MSKVVYYFSGTGNNLAVAKELSELIQEMEVHPITELLENKVIPNQYDLVGFVVPTYYAHIPPIVSECLKDLQFSAHQKVFSVIGCAGARGLSTEDIRKLVKASGKKMNYEYSLMLPDNGILVHGAPPSWYQRLTIALVKKKVKKIAASLKKAEEDKQLGKDSFYKAKSEEENQKKISQFVQNGREYTVSSDCNKCMSCGKICPAGNISMENGQIKFGSNCQQCMACIQWCHQKAIDHDKTVINRKRYHHHDITLKDMIKYNEKH